jgi:hypothetical protein
MIVSINAVIFLSLIITLLNRPFYLDLDLMFCFHSNLISIPAHYGDGNQRRCGVLAPSESEAHHLLPPESGEGLANVSRDFLSEWLASFEGEGGSH